MPFDRPSEGHGKDGKDGQDGRDGPGPSGPLDRPLPPRSAALREMYARQSRAFARRPILARVFARAWVALGDEDGFGCQVQHGCGALRADQPRADGGAGAGPDPAQLMRASLGASLAMGYRAWGARLDVPIRRVDVEVLTAHDARGQLGAGDGVAIGWQALTFDVTITSEAATPAVRRVVETADRLNPMLANLAPSIRRLHRLTVVAPAASPSRR